MPTAFRAWHRAMKPAASLALCLASTGAWAQGLMNPFGNPMAMGNPMQAMANPLANPLLLAAPLGAALLAPGFPGSSPFGYGSPLAGLAGPALGMGGMGMVHPALQMAPNLLSFQHQAPQMLTNPYLGGPFSQLPFAAPRQNTFPGWGGAPAYPGNSLSNPLQLLSGLGFPQGSGAPMLPAPGTHNPYLMMPGYPQANAMGTPPMLIPNPSAWLQPTPEGAKKPHPAETATPWQQQGTEASQAQPPAIDPLLWLAPLLQLQTQSGTTPR